MPVRVQTVQQIAPPPPPPALTVTPTVLPAATVGANYNAQFTGGNGTDPYTFQAFGQPLWLTVSSSGAVSGMPSAPGLVSFNVTVSDSLSATSTVTVTLNVLAAGAGVRITTLALPIGMVGSVYNFQLQAAGGSGTGYTYAASVVQSWWCSVSSSGVISGTPTSPGSYTARFWSTLSVVVTDSLGNHSPATILIVPYVAAGTALKCAPTLITANGPPYFPGMGTALVGVPYQGQLVAMGGIPPYSFAASGQPGWLTINSSGAMSGIPPPGSASATFSVTVTDSATPTHSTVTNAAVPIRVDATVGAPQELTIGMVGSDFAIIGFWPPAPTVSVPDYFNCYRSDRSEPVATHIRAEPWGNKPTWQYACYDTLNLAPSTSYTYTFTAVSSGVESAPSPPVTIQTLQGQVSVANPPNLPVPVADPATWIQPPTLPTGGTWWYVTNTNDTVGGSGPISSWPMGGTAGTSASPTHNPRNEQNVGCTLRWALQRCQAGDVIILTAGATYTAGATLINFSSPNPWMSSGGFGASYMLPLTQTAPPFLWIVSSEAPEVNPSGSLIPYSYTPQDMTLERLPLTAAPLANATSATLAAGVTGLTDASGNWIGSTRKVQFPVMFFTDETVYAANNTRPMAPLTCHNFSAVFTPGSNQITWFHPLPWNSQNFIGVCRLTGVTLQDRSSMPTLNVEGVNGNCIGVPPGVGYVRFVGINFQPIGISQTGPQNTMRFANDWITGPLGTITYVPPAEHIYFDRCISGDDSEQPWSNIQFYRRVTSANCNHFLVHQCYFGFTYVDDGQDQYTITTLQGGPNCIRNSYLEAVAENLFGGGTSWLPRDRSAHDTTLEYNCIPKLTTWTRQINTNSISLWTGGSANTFVGERPKNHHEYKQGAHARVHGNLFMSCWMTYAGTGSQRGRSLVYGVRDGTSNVDAFMMTPWFYISDLDIYNNEIWTVGEAMYLFANLDNPTSRVERIHFHNNTVHINPPISQAGPLIIAAYPQIFTGIISSIPVASGGSGYSGTLTVNISAPDMAGGNQAHATATQVGGVITAVSLPSATGGGGSGYTQQPTITITGSGGGSGFVAGTVLFDTQTGRPSSWPQVTENYALIQCYVNDYWIDHNTIIFNADNVNLQNPAGKTFLTSFAFFYFLSGKVIPRGERILVTNNLTNADYFMQGESAGPGGATLAGQPYGLASVHNSWFDYNLVTTNQGPELGTAANTGTNWITGVGLNGVGFAGSVNGHRIPLPVTEWNVVSGPAATFASDGGPLGARR
jgi:hypothetical protein